MLLRLAGIALLCSSLLAGCVTTTTTQTCLPGGICNDPQTTTSTWPPSSPSNQSSPHEDGDATGAIVTATALLTAVVLTAVFVKGKRDAAHDDEPRAQVAPQDIRLERMYAQAHLSARAGRCDAVVAIGKKLAREQPAEYERYAADRELAVCLPSPVAAMP